MYTFASVKSNILLFLLCFKHQVEFASLCETMETHDSWAGEGCDVGVNWCVQFLFVMYLNHLYNSFQIVLVGGMGGERGT